MLDFAVAALNTDHVQIGGVESPGRVDTAQVVEFRVLGPLEIVHRGRQCTPSAPKVLQVLAMLVLRANRVVPIDSLIEQAWGDNPPRSALTTIQTYIYQLRRFMEREGLVDNGEDVIVTRAPGYLLRVRPEQVDLQRFLMLADRGRACLKRQQYAEAARHLRAALALWYGSPLANVPSGVCSPPVSPTCRNSSAASCSCGSRRRSSSACIAS